MKTLAIAACRVSTAEQKENNSLNRQEESVLKAAQELEVEIPADAWWSGDVSSKAGTNVYRKDLKEMLAYCSAHKAVKYLIIDEPDRFMRSVDEAFYFEVSFRMVGVKVWYACDPQLNTDDMSAKLLKFSKYFSAEGSNAERQRKSVTGHQKAIRDGRYTFPPKPGYMKGPEPGIHIPHPTQFEPLQEALKGVASGLYTPSEALKKLNESSFTANRSRIKIDKFRNYLKDPYYAGVSEMKKQIQTRNEQAQHVPMITIQEHEALIAIVAGHKPRDYSRKQYNPEFPMSKRLAHDCQPEAKFTGFFQNNGHGRKYPKYRCRKCGKQLLRDVIHAGVTKVLADLEYTDTQHDAFIEALTTTWKQKQYDALSHIKMLQRQLEKLKATKSGLVRRLSASPDTIDADIRDEVSAINEEISKLETKLEQNNGLQDDLVEFVKFALEYTTVLKEDWWLLNAEERLECEQLLFPAGICLDALEKVRTTEISPLYRLATNKKDLRFDRKSLLVELAGIAPASVELQPGALQV